MAGEAEKANTSNLTHHAVDEELLKPLWIATTIARRPCAVYWVTMTVIIILTILDGLVFELNLENNERFLFVQDDKYSIWYDAWTLAEEYADDTSSGANGVNTTSSFPPQTEEIGDWTVFMMFELDDYNSKSSDPDEYFILSPSKLETIVDYEETYVTQDETWTTYYCYVGSDTTNYECNYFSLAQNVMEHFDYDYSSFTTQDVIDYVWELHENPQMEGLIEASFGSGYESTNKSKYYRSFLSGGGPVPTKIESQMDGNDSIVVKESEYEDVDDDYEAQEEKFLDDFGLDLFADITVKHEGKLKENGLRIAVLIFSAWSDYLFILFFQAVPFVLLACVAVIAWMTVHLQSLFLSCLGVVGIMLSFPFAYFIYEYIYGIGLFDFLSALIIFVLLGVGADDVFVFTDAWHQSIHFVHDPTDVEQRITYTYRRASKAMFVTQITTFFAFLATASSALVPLAAFGFWASLIVATDYILVITMYPAVLMMHHYYFKPCESKYLCCCFFGTPACPCLRSDAPSPTRTTDTTASKAKGAGDSAATGQKAEPNEVELASAAGTDGSTAQSAPKRASISHGPGVSAGDDDVELLEYRAVERFCGVTWANGILKIKYYALAAFVVLTGVALYLVITGVKPLSEAEGQFLESHWMQQLLDFSSEFGAAEEDGLGEIIVGWGVKGVNRDGSNYWDSEDYGKVKWDNSFDMSSYDAQMFMYKTCVNLSDSDIVFSKSTVVCPLNSFVNYTKEEGMDFPWTYMDRTDASYDPAVQKALFAEVLYDYSKSGSTGEGWGAGQLVYIQTPEESLDALGVANYTVRFFGIESKLDLTVATPRATSLKRRDSWDDWVDDNFRKNDNCPDGVCKPVPISHTWTWLVSQDALVSSAVQGIAIALPIAFVVMIFSTKNWIVASFATLDIIGVMLCGLSVIAVAGWELGIGESISIVLIIGFSVDYVVHLANAYLECQGTTREQRLSFSLLTMGVSVGSGAITTFLSGVFLLFPAFMIFFKMGVMMLATIVWSIIWAMFFFTSILAAFGPQGETGKVPFDKAYAKCSQWMERKCRKD